jgi:hypothetical protein
LGGPRNATIEELFGVMFPVGPPYTEIEDMLQESVFYAVLVDMLQAKIAYRLFKIFYQFVEITAVRDPPH